MAREVVRTGHRGVSWREVERVGAGPHSLPKEDPTCSP